MSDTTSDVKKVQDKPAAPIGEGTAVTNTQVPEPEGKDVPAAAQGDLRARSIEPQDPPAPVANGTQFIPAWAVVAMVGVVAALLAAAVVYVAWSSMALYSRGIDQVITLNGSVEATVVARRVFLLASGQQIVAFKAISYGVAIMVALAGIVLVLNGAQAAYSLDLEREGGSKAALTTTSPGLVVITLAMALAAATLWNKSSVRDHNDSDLYGSGTSQTRAVSGEEIADIRTRVPAEELANTPVPDEAELDDIRKRTAQ